jgi:hypothetical protein
MTYMIFKVKLFYIIKNIDPIIRKTKVLFPNQFANRSWTGLDTNDNEMIFALTPTFITQ